MSLSQETYSIPQPYSESSSVSSSLFLSIPPMNHFRFNPSKFRAPLQIHSNFSINNDLYSPEGLSAQYRRPPRLNERTHEPVSSQRLSRRMKEKLQTKIYEESYSPHKEINSPFCLEPQSSSSQPSEAFSISHKESSPLRPPEGFTVKEEEEMEFAFTEELYQRVNHYLDNEGLELIDPMDFIRHVSRPRLEKTSYEEDGNGVNSVKSANHSPKFISDHIWGSSLFQRRCSRSQGPKAPINPLSPARPERLMIRHFKEDLKQIMQTASPIEEKDTPVISRNNSGFQENTPEKGFPQKFNFSRNRHFPGSAQNKAYKQTSSRNILAIYAVKSSNNLKSPQRKLKPMASVAEISLVKKSYQEKQSSSLCSSPSKVDPEDSLKKPLLYREDNRRKIGMVIKKSRFQKLRELQECLSMN